MKPLRIRSRARRGVVAVEFALMVAFVLVPIVFGAIDVGRFINVAQTVNDASREGARWASRNDLSDVDAVVLNYLQNALDPRLTAEEITVDPENVDVFDSLGTPMPSVSVRVAFSYDNDKVRWLVHLPWLSGKTLTTTTVMRRE